MGDVAGLDWRGGSRKRKKRSGTVIDWMRDGGGGDGAAIWNWPAFLGFWSQNLLCLILYCNAMKQMENFKEGIFNFVFK